MRRRAGVRCAADAAKGALVVVQGTVFYVMVGAGLLAYVVNRKAACPELFMVIYSLVFCVAVVAYFVYLVVGAVMSDGEQRGSFIGEAVIVGFFGAGLVALAVKVMQVYRAKRGR